MSYNVTYFYDTGIQNCQGGTQTFLNCLQGRINSMRTIRIEDVRFDVGPNIDEITNVIRELQTRDDDQEHLVL